VIVAGWIARNDRLTQDRLLAFFRDRGVPSLDLLPDLRENAEACYFPVDQHFNAAGHARASEGAARAILDGRLRSREL
jgi:hypothetical protein